MSTSRTPEYTVWAEMKRRCHNPKNKSWRWYGAVGVAVCERWQTFANFLADMGPRPDGLTIDRINPRGNYEPGNCRWATMTEQHLNRRLQARTHCRRGHEFTDANTYRSCTQRTCRECKRLRRARP